MARPSRFCEIVSAVSRRALSSLFHRSPNQQALVETFGSGVQEVLAQPGAERALRRCPGIGAAKAQRIARAWQEANGTRAAFAFARDLGLSHAHAHALAERHGNTLEAKMRQDPYAVLEPLGLSLACVGGCMGWGKAVCGLLPREITGNSSTNQRS